ncbi:hypothetical protein CDD83_448 [Cordyceps sp. RAO-2017]|nr:hypothetical protein CDD83_448 [Cordyceps sp. RAO-2017]
MPGTFDELPPSQSSRGAFGPAFGFGEDAGRYDGTGFARPMPPSWDDLTTPRAAGHAQQDSDPRGARRSGKAGRAEHRRAESSSSRRSSSLFQRHSSPGRPDGATHGSPGDASASSANPYYKPSRFASARRRLHRTAPAGASGPRFRATTPRDPDRVPDPIIEEPDSPPGPPAPPIRLLGEKPFTTD